MPNRDVTRIANALAVADRVVRDYTPGQIQSTIKEGGDPLTEADTAVDRAIKTELLRSGEGWLSEETADGPERLDRSRVWIVDPIDGTREFIEGIPEWCVSIALAVDGRAVAGGILNPMTGERFLGSAEGGITYEGRRPPTDAVTLADAEVLASRSEVNRGEWDWAVERSLKVTPMGSVAYKLALVAAGRADATWTLVPKHEWDVAAGSALLTAAAVHQRRSDGAPLMFNRPDTLLPGFVASSQRTTEAVEKFLSGHV